jgi:hypothetical protein
LPYYWKHSPCRVPKVTVFFGRLQSPFPPPAADFAEYKIPRNPTVHVEFTSAVFNQANKYCILYDMVNGRMPDETPPFAPPEPRLEFAFEVHLKFYRTPSISNVPIGGSRGYVCLESGTFSGPNISGKAVPYSGGDYAHFRSDGVTSFEARYLLEEDDGTRILLNNHGYSWFRDEDAARKWEEIKDGKREGKAVDPSTYYFRTFPTFEAPVGKHDWLTKTVIVGSGARALDGNVIRYYKVL